MITVRVDDSICNGCGLCETMCPEVFAVREDIAIVLVDEVPDEVEAPCMEAVECCPVEAIVMHEGEYIET